MPPYPDARWACRGTHPKPAPTGRRACPPTSSKKPPDELMNALDGTKVYRQASRGEARPGRPVVTTPVPRDVWDSLVRSDPAAVVTQSLAWRDAVFASGRYRDVSRLYEFGSGRRIVLPLARRRFATAWTATTASWPRQWGNGGPICEDGQVSAAEAEAVLADLARSTVGVAVRLPEGPGGPWLAAA